MTASTVSSPPVLGPPVSASSISAPSVLVSAVAVPTVSVVVPAYNSTGSIPDTLKSVLAQSFGDFELLIVNDGSTDDLAGVIAPLAAQDDRIRMISQDNGGLAAARNRGLAEARADLIAFLDADDIWHPDFLAHLTEALARDPASSFGYAYSLRFDTANVLISLPQCRHVPKHDLCGLLRLNSVGNGSAAVFRTALVRAAGGFDTGMQARGLQGAEDWKLCLTMAAQSAPVLVPRTLVGYRLDVNSMSQRAPQRQLQAVMAVMDDLRGTLPAIPRQTFLDARTVMNGWLMPAFWRLRDYPRLARLLLESYVLNPLWFLSRDVRSIHLHKLVSVIGQPVGRTRLADWVEDGRRPFAFLDANLPATRHPAARRPSAERPSASA